MKVCRTCQKDLPEESFYLIKKTGKPNTRCKDCCYQYVKRWQDKNRDRFLELVSNWRKAHPDYQISRRLDQFAMRDGPKKSCATCLKELPTTCFYSHTSNTDRLQKNCISCFLKLQAEYRANNKDWIIEHNREWQAKNRDRARKAATIVNARNRSEKVAANEAKGKPTCQIHGVHDDWWHSPLKTRWSCQKCSKESVKLHGRKQEQKRQIDSLAKKHGPQMRREYEALMADPEFVAMGGQERIYEVKRRVFLRDHGIVLNKDQSKRIITLNRLEGRHTLNIGWACKGCGSFHKEPYMVDIDHILPRCKEGRDADSNLQILCLWCHRKKTLIDIGKSGSFFEAPVFSQFPSPSADTGGSSGSRLVMLQPPTEA